MGSHRSQGGKQVSKEEDDQGMIVLTHDLVNTVLARGNSETSLSGGCTGARMGFCPDTPGSLEGNTEGPGTASSEPLLPS